MRALITRLFGKRDMQHALEGYGELVAEAAKLREVNKSLIEALEFYAAPEAYEGNPVPVMEDRGMAARVVLQVAKELLGESSVSA